MRTSKCSEEQVIGFLKQADAGLPVKDLWAAAGLMDTWLRWKIEPEVVYGNETALQP